MKKFFILFLSQLLVVMTLISLFLFGVAYFYSDSGLYSDKTLLKFAEDDVLGNPSYKGTEYDIPNKLSYKSTCPRILYAKEVEYPYGHGQKGEKSAAIFLFRPLPEHASRCPPVEVMMSRHTGEAWLTFKNE